MRHYATLFGRKIRHAAYRAESVLRRLTGMHEPESKLVADNQAFWEDTNQSSFEQNSHWRGGGPFVDDDLWLRLGESHWRIFQKAADWTAHSHSLGKTVEWGCGGGMNAIHFAPMSAEFYGVDISQESLIECGKQIARTSQSNYSPVLVKADDPEAAIDIIGTECDAFISTYVFELLPTPEYCRRILRVAHSLLKQNGIALIQIRYQGRFRGVGSRGWRYGRNMTKMSTFGLDEFWRTCTAEGFEPLFVKLVPRQEELNEQLYAYFALRNETGKAGCDDHLPQTVQSDQTAT